MAKMMYNRLEEAGRQDGTSTLATLTRPTEPAADRAHKTIPSGTQTVNCEVRVGRRYLQRRCQDGK